MARNINPGPLYGMVHTEPQETEGETRRRNPDQGAEELTNMYLPWAAQGSTPGRWAAQEQTLRETRDSRENRWVKGRVIRRVKSSMRVVFLISS